ncbi:RNA polymerase sigma factor [Blautia producta]|uniref:RNA polymerase sigma factor n=1 Tax=Blautia producta TaxID=33035 RepID=UPI0031B5F929
MMKPSSFEEAIRLQFDTLTKRVVDTTVKDYGRELSRRLKREATFSDLPDVVVDSLHVWDEYELSFTAFDVYGTEVRVSDDMLCEALKQLPEKKRNVLLMSYFLELSDISIGELLQMTRDGVYKNRMAGLKLLRDLLKEE